MAEIALGSDAAITRIWVLLQYTNAGYTRNWFCSFAYPQVSIPCNACRLSQPIYFVDITVADTIEPLYMSTAAFDLCCVYRDIEWLGSRVVSVLDSDAEGPGYSRSRDAVG